ncbi:MAG: hypothetical protein ACLQU5_06410 [Isosphaeraceae bacterium]
MAVKKTRQSPAARPPGRTRKTIGLDADLARRLATYAAWHSRDQSDVVAQAIEPLLRGFYATHRATGAEGPARLSTEEPPAAERPGPRLAEAV